MEFQNRNESRRAFARGEITWMQRQSWERKFDEQAVAEKQATLNAGAGAPKDLVDAVADRVITEWRAEGKLTKPVVPKIETREQALEMIRKLEANPSDVIDAAWANELRELHGVLR